MDQEKLENYRDQLRARLKQLDAEIDKLAARGELKEAEIKAELHEHLEHLRSRRQELLASADKLKHSSGEAWEDIKEGVEHAWAELGRAISAARDRFS